MCFCGSVQRVGPHQRAACPISGTAGRDVELLDPAKTTPRAIAEAITKGTGFTAEPEAAVRN